ncbi:MAG TPA: TIGR04283 family arsenosugar biosynthesis glycosyltransferase [Pyrinomonadaceae bacterium]|nr:TIGR04283 family arsenosugar biosynthesis glycosyltransferase [Pyrinomonadaceae bacterium]
MNGVVENGRPSVSLIIPTLNEEKSIGATLESIARVKGDLEVIVADGGSEDRTIEIARHFGATVITSDRGRGTQMHTGARAARGQTFLFLHADTSSLPSDLVERIDEALLRDVAALGGNFAIRFDGSSRAASFMTWLYPKLRKLGLCYGDSGIFVRASVYREIGGFNSFPLFEDLDFIRRLQKRGRMIHLPVELVTSARRFEGRRFPFTFARWSILQALYWIGVSPRTLSRFYDV